MTPVMITFYVLLGVFLIALYAFYKKTVVSGQQRQVSNLTNDAVILSILLVMGFVPQLGFIMVAPGVALTIMHIPVLIGAYRFGAKRGWLYGLFFGFVSWMVALQNAIGFNAFFVFPWVSVLPRLIFGLVAGIAYSLLKKNKKLYNKKWPIALTSVLLTYLHTGLVFLDLYMFYPQEMIGFFGSTGTLGTALNVGIGIIVGVGATGEALLGGILTPIVGKALEKTSRNKEVL